MYVDEVYLYKSLKTKNNTITTNNNEHVHTFSKTHHANMDIIVVIVAAKLGFCTITGSQMRAIFCRDVFKTSKPGVVDRDRLSLAVYNGSDNASEWPVWVERSTTVFPENLFHLC